MARVAKDSAKIDEGNDLFGPEVTLPVEVWSTVNLVLRELHIRKTKQP